MARSGPLGHDEERLLRATAEDLLGDIDRLAESVSEQVLVHEPDLRRLMDEVGELALRRSSVANVGAVLSTLAFGVAPASVDPPDGALDLVHAVASTPGGLPLILRAYRLGAAATWQRLAGQLGTRVRDPESLTRLVLVASAHLYDYTDHVSRRLCDQWAEIDRRSTADGQRREAALHAAMRGEPLDRRALDHPLDGYHVAVAVRRCADARPTVVDRAVADLLAWFTRSPSVRLTQPDGSQIVWLSPTSRPSPSVVEGLAVVDGVHLACSDVGVGEQDFVRVAREATDTLAVIAALHPRGGSGSYRRHALAATLLADAPRARRLADVVLGPLAEEGPEAERMRSTLRAYFAAGGKKAAASQVLGIHEKTVAYRLRKAAALLGESVDDRRLELEAALLVHAALAPRREPGGASGGGRQLPHGQP